MISLPSNLHPFTEDTPVSVAGAIKRCLLPASGGGRRGFPSRAMRLTVFMKRDDVFSYNKMGDRIQQEISS
jgi:hypothetical protein